MINIEKVIKWNENQGDLMMKAVGIEKFGDCSEIRSMEVRIPRPLDHEVQIKVAYAGVNPVDWKVCEGLVSVSNFEFPVLLGWDFSGVITEVGKEVSRFKKGDAVFGCFRSAKGSFAEYICADEKVIARKPGHLSFAEAAAIPLGSLTAWQGVIESGKVIKSENILIHAGAGGVGSFAIQFAHFLGCKIVTTAQMHHHDYVKKLGADYPIDYTKRNFILSVRELFPDGVDFIFDGVGGDVLKKSYEVVRKGGRLVTIVEEPDMKKAKEMEIAVSHFHFKPNGEMLGKIGGLLDDRILMPPSIEELPLSKTKEAIEKVKRGHTQGKIVLRVF